jgi:hypothetical protein
MADWYKLNALIVGLGVDPHEGLESVFLQRVLCLTTPSQHPVTVGCATTVASQIPGPMLWSGSTSLAVSLTSLVACSGQVPTQALEPIQVWVSMT